MDLLNPRRPWYVDLQFLMGSILSTISRECDQSWFPILYLEVESVTIEGEEVGVLFTL
jgi:hypothetical protein